MAHAHIPNGRKYPPELQHLRVFPNQVCELSGLSRFLTDEDAEAESKATANAAFSRHQMRSYIRAKDRGWARNRRERPLNSTMCNSADLQ